MFAGAGVATVVGYGLGFISFKYGLRGPFFALVTIAFAEILRLLALYFDFTGGPLGYLSRWPANTLSGNTNFLKRSLIITLLLG